MSPTLVTVLICLAGVLGGSAITIIITGFATNWFAPVAPVVTSGPSVMRSKTNERVQFSEEAQFATFAGPLSNIPSTRPKIMVDHTQRFQKLIGFGAAITDSSAYNINQIPTIEKQDELLQKLFHPTNGVNMSFLRLPNSCSDFSLENYTYDDVEVGQTDMNLNNFTIEKARTHMIPMVKRILAINPNVYLMLSPWSPPAWMKTQGRYTGMLVGTVNGTRSSLIPDSYTAYANLWVKTIKAFWAEGIPVKAITLNNEPHYPPPDYPGLWMDFDEQTKLLNEYVVPAFERDLGGHVEIWAWDHNWDEREFCSKVFRNLTAQAQKWVVGCAWHCYAGDVNDQSYFHNEFPNARHMQTECSGGGRWDHPPVWTPPYTNFVFGSNYVWDMKTLFINELNNWGEGSQKWNMALNENGGPRNNGCYECRGVVTVNSVTKAVTYNVDYYAIGTMSKYFPAGSYRIGVASTDSGLVTTAAVTPDGYYVVVVLNQFSKPTEYAITWNSLYVLDTIEGETSHVFKWKP